MAGISRSFACVLALGAWISGCFSDPSAAPAAAAGTSGTAGSSSGSAGASGSSAGGTSGASAGGTAGTSGGAAGTSGGTAGTSGGAAGTAGSGGCSGSEKACSAAGVPQTCQGGVFVDSDPCMSPTPACLDGLCVQCEPGTMSCLGTTAIRTCNGTGTYNTTTVSCVDPTPVCVNAQCVGAIVRGGFGTSGIVTPDPTSTARLRSGGFEGPVRSCGTQGSAPCVTGSLRP